MSYYQSDMAKVDIGTIGANNFSNSIKIDSKNLKIDLILVSSGLGTVIASEFGMAISRNQRFHIKNYFSELHTSDNLCSHLILFGLVKLYILVR